MLWLQYSVCTQAYQLQGQTFSQRKWLNSIAVETCGSCATRAMPPFLHITTSDSPAEHDINRRRVIWDWLLWNDSQTSRAEKGKEKSLEGQGETQSNALLILPSFRIAQCSRWPGSQVQDLSSRHATWRHVWFRIYKMRYYETYHWCWVKTLYFQMWTFVERITHEIA